MIGKRYLQQEQLGIGGMGVVFRVFDRLNQETVALKRVIRMGEAAIPPGSNAERHSLNLRMALAQEFGTLASLRHPYIIDVLDYGFDADRHPFFTMELLEDARPLVKAVTDAPQTEKLRVIGQLLQALNYLHRRGVLHRDLKPDNVVLFNGSVKVLDFGLAVARQFAGENEDETVGTLAYMAPEIIQGLPASAASDLYAIGVMLYEMLAGRHPFDASSPSTLINQTLTQMPDVQGLNLEPALTLLLDTLLAKDPAMRGTTDEALSLLMTVDRKQIAIETDTIRDSFLQAAEFVGREDELSRLTIALASTQGGAGSGWLLGGESGVGKSRLLDELRTWALVKGVQVVRGQAVAEAAQPYQVWRGVLRWLVLLTDLSDLEASVIKPLVPDIAALLDRPVDDAPELDLQAMQQRLHATIEEVLLRQTEPLLIVLEDLHWASADDLGLLKRLSRTLDAKPLLIVGSYRDDEKETLPEQLPDMQVLKLNRLGSSAITKLSEAMLGPVGRQAAVVELLQRETEGNVFFVVEVVRALAEEAGTLDRITGNNLPQQVFAGGIQAVTDRRLNRIPASARPLLELAAILGRQLDMGLLSAAAPDIDMETWQTQASAAAILTVQDDTWRFAHDKLRERLLSTLSPDARRAHHRNAAATIEQVYGATPEQLTHLAYHWGMAGDAAKEAHYAARAGELMLANASYREAIDYLTDALALNQQTGSERAYFEHQLAEAHYCLGELDASRDHAEIALTLLGLGLPKSTPAQAAALARQIGLQVLHRRQPERYFARPVEDRRELLTKIRAYERLAVLYYLANKTLISMACGFYTLNNAELYGVSAELARAYSNITVACGLIPLHGQARAYLARALKTAEQAPRALRWILFVSGIYHNGIGEFKTSLDEFARAVQIVQEQGDRNGYEEVLTSLTKARYYSGQLQQCLEVARNLEEVSRVRNNHVNRVAGIIDQFAALYRLGRTEAMAALMPRMKDELENTYEIARISGYGQLALGSVRAGDLTAARTYADKATEFLLKGRPSSYQVFDAFIGASETHLTLWEQGETDAAVQARKLVKKAMSTAKIFLALRPAAYRCQAWMLWLEGKDADARTAIAESARLAAEMGMPYEEGRAWLELARHIDGPEQTQAAGRAAEIFSRIDAAYDLARAQALAPAHVTV